MLKLYSNWDHFNLVLMEISSHDLAFWTHSYQATIEVKPENVDGIKCVLITRDKK